MSFEADGSLPDGPDPWRASSVPPARGGPPYVMTEMIAAEPGLAARIVLRLSDPESPARRLAEAVRAAGLAGEPIVVTGCGTSEHAAQAGAEILADALRRADLPGEPRAVQAFEAALEPVARGLLIAISHEGGTAKTNAALEAARSSRTRTALITVSDRSPGAALADIVVATGEQDQSWCHTVGYLSPIVAASVVGGLLAGPLPDGQGLRALLEAGDDASGAERIADTLAQRRPILVLATGADRPAGRELVLKLEEGAWLPSAYRDLETFLHGHLAATDGSTALVLVLTERRARGARLARAIAALTAARRVGIASAAILASDAAAGVPDELTPAGRIVVPESPELPAPVASLLATTTPLQLLAERTARRRGVNPDLMRRDDEAYREAAAAAG